MRGIVCAVLLCSIACADTRGQFFAPPDAEVSVSSSAPPVVVPGQSIPWTLHVTVQSASYLGMAGFAADLIQTAGPGPLVLSPGIGPPSSMVAFDRPLGFATTGANGTGSGYGGIQFASGFGGMDLKGIEAIRKPRNR